MIKKLTSLILLINLIVTFCLIFNKNYEIFLLSIYSFITFWGIDKYITWTTSSDIWIGPMIKIKHDAEPSIRILGLLLAIFLISFGTIHIIIYF